LRVKRAHELHALSYVIVRPASVYGPREKGPTYGMYKAIRSGVFAMLGGGDNLMHYVYVKDLVRGAIQAGESKLPVGDYILAGAKPERFKDVVNSVCVSIGADARVKNLPLWLAYPSAYALEFVGSLVGWKPPLFPSRIKTMLSSYSYSIAKAKRDIGYRPTTSIVRGMAETGKWYLENGKL
jgi:nucleoside-diphosphate-sugar epimerase